MYFYIRRRSCMGFVHLHVNTEFSLLYGECRLDKLCEKIKNNSQSAVAITDKGNLFGAVEFYKLCKKNNIKAIIGCELSISERSRFERVRKAESISSIVLLVKNNEGYKNLVKLVTSAYLDGADESPRIDRELLKRYHNGLILLTGGEKSGVINNLLSYNVDAAKEELGFYKDLFGEDCYVELNRHGTSVQKSIEGTLLLLAKKMSMPLVAANEVRYVEKESAELHQAITMIGNGSTYDDDENKRLSNSEYYLKSTEEMEKIFIDIPEAIENTEYIARLCNFEFEFGKFHLPEFPVPEGDNKSYLRTKTYEGLKRRKTNDSSVSLRIYNERVNYELSIIEKMGFVDYFLIVDDFVRFAKNRDIPVGPGRGSGVGSLVAFCLGITDVDPIKYGLLFERFLNPERVSMPDFDIDFCYDRRGEVIEYVKEKYGAEHVAQIITFGTMSCRAAIRDVGRILGMTHQEIDVIAKLLPKDIGITVDDALKDVKKLSELYNNDLRIKKLLDISRELDGRPRHASTHATAVIITDKPINEYMPLSRNGDVVVTQYAMNEVAELGLLKIDFLGLRNLTILKKAENLVREKNSDFSLEQIDLFDDKTFSLIGSGKTSGVFQLESEGMKSLLVKMKPKCFEDIIVAISLYRPGPMQSISVYLKNREHPDLVEYACDELKDIIGETFGCIIYQEQVMEICRSLAGFSYGHADIIRRVMAKKKMTEMEKEREGFIEGALANGISEKISSGIFDTMNDFAKYAFNKSHAAAYAITSYRTAYMKAHYPKEFMCSLLSSVLGQNDKTREYIEETKSMGIEVLPPDINHSEMYHSVEDCGIRFGLLGVKNVGVSLVKAILHERENGKFRSVEDFLERVHSNVNVRMVVSLVQCGAFDSFGIYRSRLFGAIPAAFEELDKAKKREFEGQIGLFDSTYDTVKNRGSFINYENIDEYSYEQKLAFEKELTGVYLSGHPLADYHHIYDNNVLRIKNVKELCNNSQFKTSFSVLGMVGSVRVLKTKKGDEMAFASFEDCESECQLVVFPKIFEKTAPLWENGNIIIVSGSCELSDDESLEEPYLKIIVENANKAIKTQNSMDTYDIYIKITGNKSWENAVNEVRKSPEGSSNLMLYFENDKRLVKVKNLSFKIDETLVQILKKQFGDDNVVLKCQNK